MVPESQETTVTVDRVAVDLPGRGKLQVQERSGRPCVSMVYVGWPCFAALAEVCVVARGSSREGWLVSTPEGSPAGGMQVKWASSEVF